VLDHDPTHEDITAFVGRLKSALAERGVALQGITTDGSPLSPEPIRRVCGAVSHPMCPFHLLKELTQGLLHAVAAERRRLAKSTPKLQRGRPSSQAPAARRLARTRKRRQEKIRDVCQGRFFLVKRHRKPSERTQLLPITRGLPQVRQWRAIMEHLSALFDRRCRMQTALDKLKKLRQWVRRFSWIGDPVKKVCSPTLDKARTLLDDKLLPATSKAVERGNRRHRKRHKSVYRVRSQVRVEGRIALDMLRASRTENRERTPQTLHHARRGSP
jgi:hypothetical protein